MKKAIAILMLLLVNLAGFTNAIAQFGTIENYNVVWKSPGMNSQGSMPLGNGDIGLNAWVEENGDLVFYVSKTDAWSENGQLLKLGKVRVSLYPNPFNAKMFLQKLEPGKGKMTIDYGNAKINLWVDANNPVIQVDVDSKEPLKAHVTFETWRKNRYQVKGDESFAIYGIDEVGKDNNFINPVYREADTILTGQQNRVISCHHNTYSQWKNNLALQALGDFANSHADPLLDRTFGLCMEGDNLVSETDTSLASKAPSKHIQLNIFPLTQTGNIESWKNSLLKSAAAINQIPFQKRLNAHYAWWKAFWNRNFIFITSADSVSKKQAETVTRGYILQRFINACGGRGNAPIKFNGSIFTVDTYNRKGANAGLNADFRAWGGCYWWQNTRLPYWSMLISGDYDLMNPLFKMYMDALPLRNAATEKYYHHAGAFYPETINFWGTYNNNNYGTNRKDLADGYTTNPYIRYYWSGGLELSLMMLDYYSFTGSKQFAKDTLVPFVSEILTFFDQHWKRGDDGKILFSPAMSLETFHTAVDPLPEIVGIKKVAEKMLALSGTLIGTEQRRQWETLINDLPSMPLRVVNNDTLIAPAREYSNKQNFENPELYAVFPYRTFGIGKPNIGLAKRTFDARVYKDNGGWQQNSIQAAYLGFTNEAKRMIVESFSSWDKNFLFPAFWGPNYDWTPDQDHGSVAMNALQRMIIQYEDNQVLLLPAWPKEWDVHFKVNAPGNTTIECILEKGKIVNLNVSPASRLKEVKMGLK